MATASSISASPPIPGRAVRVRHEQAGVGARPVGEHVGRQQERVLRPPLAQGRHGHLGGQHPAGLRGPGRRSPGLADMLNALDPATQCMCPAWWCCR